MFSLLLLSCTSTDPAQYPKDLLPVAIEQKEGKVSLDPIYTNIIDLTMNSDGAMEKLIELCDDIGPRLSGSANLERATIWAKVKLASEGLSNSRHQKVMVPHWQRGNESLHLVSPREMDVPMLGLGMSIGTDGRPARAEVVVVSSFEELDSLGVEKINGKIVLYNVPFTNYGETVQYRSRGADKASAYGAIAVLVRSVSPISLSTPHTGALSYKEGTPIPAAAITIEAAEMFQRWYKREKKIEVVLTMEAKMFPDAPSANVIAEIPGSERPNEIVVIGGHIDSWDVGQGAQDDGAGVVISMEAGRILASLPTPPKRTIRVVLFTNEENGLQGGKTYAAQIAATQKHFAAIEADIGSGVPQYFSYKLPESITEEGFASWKQALEGAELAISTLGMQYTQPGYAGADIGPLVELGVPGFGLRMDSSTYWPIHHTHADTIEKVDPQLLKKNTAAMAVWAWALANLEL
jgi:carboxypeptidase Q